MRIAAEAFHPCGALLLAKDDHDAERLTRIAAPDHWSSVRRAFVESAEASAKAGRPLHRPALWLPDAGVVRPPRLIARLLEGVEVRLSAAAATLKRTAAGWRALDESGAELAAADLVVVAAGPQSARFAQLSHLPLQGSLGQISTAPSRGGLADLQCVLAGGPYVTPSVDGTHIFGASYEPWPVESEWGAPTAARRSSNVERLKHWVPGIDGSVCSDDAETLDRVALRCTTPDRSPLAGPAPDATYYADAFDGLRKGRRQNYPYAKYHDGLFVIAGLGSRGFLTAPLAAMLVAAQAAGAPLPTAADIAEATHPGRFLIRALKRGAAPAKALSSPHRGDR
ncbi:MAG: FAD-dependent 5-carboxymethylaminomethyl-2-thiouridine(34) oxidoreductase MnmC [Pseudomonadota bacterium]